MHTTFEEIYQKFIDVDKVNKDLKMIIQTLSLENDRLKAKIEMLEQEHEQLIITNKKIALQLTEKDDKLHKSISRF